jgi:signal transduction histidine kinase
MESPLIDPISLRLKSELCRELVLKSATASIGFFLLSLWVMYSKMEVVAHADFMLFLGWGLLLLACSRYLIHWSYQKNKILLPMATLLTQVNVVVNAILWASVAGLTIDEYKFTNFESSMMTVILLFGLSFSSVVTLSSSRWIALAFQFILTLPSISYLTYVGLYQNNSAARGAAVCVSIALIYCVRETFNIYSQIRKRLHYEIELIESNLRLNESQQMLIKETAKLQHATRLATLGEISGEVAHEINNPLAIIKGNISLVLLWMNSAQFNIETLKEKLLKSASAVDRITKIVKGLQNFSRETDRDAYVNNSLDEIIHDCVEFCSEKFSYNQIKLEVKCESSYQISCRPIEISQVLLNILSNAISALGEVPVESRWIRITTEVWGDFYKLSISNSGPPITEENRRKLFQPFFSTKKVGEGTGLGLSISKAIIEAHNGRLYLDPQKGPTTFVIEVPKADLSSISPKV